MPTPGSPLGLKPAPVLLRIPRNREGASHSHRDRALRSPSADSGSFPSRDRTSRMRKPACDPAVTGTHELAMPSARKIKLKRCLPPRPVQLLDLFALPPMTPANAAALDGRPAPPLRPMRSKHSLGAARPMPVQCRSMAEDMSRGTIGPRSRTTALPSPLAHSAPSASACLRARRANHQDRGTGPAKTHRSVTYRQARATDRRTRRSAPRPRARHFADSNCMPLVDYALRQRFRAAPLYGSDLHAQIA